MRCKDVQLRKLRHKANRTTQPTNAYINAQLKTSRRPIASRPTPILMVHVTCTDRVHVNSLFPGSRLPYPCYPCCGYLSLTNLPFVRGDANPDHKCGGYGSSIQWRTRFKSLWEASLTALVSALVLSPIGYRKNVLTAGHNNEDPRRTQKSTCSTVCTINSQILSSLLVLSLVMVSASRSYTS